MFTLLLYVNNPLLLSKYARGSLIPARATFSLSSSSCKPSQGSESRGAAEAEGWEDRVVLVEKLRDVVFSFALLRGSHHSCLPTTQVTYEAIQLTLQENYAFTLPDLLTQAVHPGFHQQLKNM